MARNLSIAAIMKFIMIDTTINPERDHRLMRLAIKCARDNDTPYGALALDTNSSRNIVFPNTTSENDRTAHAEMNVLRNLNQLDFEQRENIVIYSTAEPCPMCMGAILWSGIKHIKFGIRIDQVKQFHPQIEISASQLVSAFSYKCEIEHGILEQECLALFNLILDR